MKIIESEIKKTKNKKRKESGLRQSEVSNSPLMKKRLS